MVKGRTGKDLLMLNGYTYYQHKLLKDGYRWSCTQMGSRSCRGFLHVTNDMLVIRAQTDHTHPPSTYFLENRKRQKKDVFEFYLRPNGRINLRLNNFTFYKHLKARSNAHRWSCTAYGSKWKCKAHLIITDKLEVLKANVSHSHPPSVKKDTRTPNNPSYRLWNGTGNKENTRQTPHLPEPPSLTPLHDYLIAHSFRIAFLSKKQVPKRRTGVFQLDNTTDATVPGARNSVQNPGTLIKYTNGRQLYLLQGYTFKRNSVIRKGTATRWICSQHHKCPVYVHLDKEFRVIHLPPLCHTHEPPKLLRVKTGLREFDNGRKRYCLGGYTFYKHKPILRGDASRWLCTRRQCPVYLHLDSDLNLLYRPSREHPHPPVCIYRNASERDDEATTSTSTGLRGPRRKTAQYYRDYRARKRAEQEKESLYRTSYPSTTANSFRRTRKTNAEYQREYRARQKAKRNNMLIDSLAVLPPTSTGGLTSSHQSTIVDQLTTTGLVLGL
ncbi:hypothetical protein KGM_208270 [Danaus plexippus plexippus]|uniref:FLYWCH-type domain-containing protein n=1 Tax=Danaus plexippus plexippus TaxID=278856 RepID=A0A212EXQ4_DANPL|nr:hypothetical protein KGM_208270 [Danaus plexippus plexippus]